MLVSDSKQRVQFRAFIEARSGHGEEIVAKGFAACGGAADSALGLPCGGGRRGGEAVGGRAFANLANPRMLVLAVDRLRVQRFVNLLAPEDRGSVSSRLRDRRRAICCRHSVPQQGL